MKHIMLLVITLGSKDLTIGGSRLENTFIHSNQASASIDIRVHGDWDIPFNSLKSGTEMQIIGFERNSDGGIPPVNIVSFNLLYRLTFYFSNIETSWPVTAKNESENPGGNSI